MKKTVVLLGLLFFIISLKAQMTLKHTFEETSNEDFNYAVSNVMESTSNSNVVKYFSLDYRDNTIKIYNKDYSFHKIVPVVFPEGYNKIIAIYHASTKAFNTDEKVELNIVFRNSENDFLSQIINEDGEVWKSFPGLVATFPYVCDSEIRVNIAYEEMNPDNGVYVHKIDIYIH